MQAILLNLILINVMVTAIVDLTDAPDTLKKALTWVLTGGKMSRKDYRFHLFDCSLCITFWLSILYILLTGHFSLAFIALCILSALFTQITKSLILLCMDMMNAIIILINKIIKYISKL